jgi:hypothetical protein
MEDTLTGEQEKQTLRKYDRKVEQIKNIDDFMKK